MPQQDANPSTSASPRIGRENGQLRRADVECGHHVDGQDDVCPSQLCFVASGGLRGAALELLAHLGSTQLLAAVHHGAVSWGALGGQVSSRTRRSQVLGAGAPGDTVRAAERES